MLSIEAVCIILCQGVFRSTKHQMSVAKGCGKVDNKIWAIIDLSGKLLELCKKSK